MIRKYHNKKLQANLWHREEEPHNNHETPGRQTKQSNQLSVPHRDYCKTRVDTKYAEQNIEQLQNPTMGVTMNKESQNLRTDSSQTHPTGCRLIEAIQVPRDVSIRHLYR